MITTTAQVFEWMADHANLIAWPALLGFVWKFRGRLDSYLASWSAADKRIQSVEKMTLEVHGSVNDIQANHLKHLLDETEKTNVFLQNIDSGIKILVDRGRREI